MLTNKAKILTARRSALVAFLFVILSLSAGMAWQTVSSADIQIFQEANEKYRQGDFDGAIEIYQTLAKDHPRNAALFYNLGNSYYRRGSLGASILAYERARLLAPRNSDVLRNLNYVQSLLEYRVEDKRNWYLSAGEKVLERFRDEEVALLFLITYFFFMASLAAGLFLRRGEFWNFRRKTLAAFLVAVSILFIMKNVDRHVIRDAVIMVKEADVRYGPSRGDRVAFRLGEGLKVNIIDMREDWSRVLLANGESGWVEDSDIEKV